MKKLTIALLGSTLLATAPAYAKELNLICAADVVVCETLVGAFEKAHGDIHVNMVRLSSGETYAKLRAEARNPQTDLWWGGTGDPHLQAAHDGLTAVYKSPMLDKLRPWAVNQAKVSGYRTVGVYSGALGWGYNTDIFKEKNLKPPHCWKDLLDSSYKGEIEIADPNSSGTAYTTLATLVQIMGEDQAFDFLKKLNKNVSQYTKSGSAPIKAAARGETGIGIVFQHDAVAQAVEGFPIKVVSPCEGTGYEIGSMSIVKGAQHPEEAKVFYNWVLTPAAQELMPKAKSFQIPSNKSSRVPKEAPDLSSIKLIDYDFEKYGSSDVRKALLQRWDKEIGGRAGE
jgi:iron(III) transport system substrate-binding protein